MKWIPSKEHIAQIPDWNARWIAKICSTDPIDVEKMKLAADGMYGAVTAPSVPWLMPNRS